MPFINQYKARIGEWLGKLINLPNFPGPNQENIIELQTYIKEYKNLMIEIGSGSGQHLIELALKYPNYGIIGFELRYKRSVRTLEKAKLRKINNLLIVRGDAKYIDLLFSKNTINRIYINFPDPWDKKSWFKNRIISNDFLIKIHPLLKINGELAYKSDHQGYFEESLKLFNESDLFEVIELSKDLHNSSYNQNNILTEFEQLFLSKSQVIYYVLIRKKQ